jgi:hypothetical protein
VRASIFRFDSRVPGRVLALTLTLIFTTATSAGCGSQEKPKAEPSPTSRPSQPSGPPGLDTTPPRKPGAAETQESAAEYGRYFAMLVQHAVRIRNVRPLLAEAHDQAKCTSCRKVGEFIEKELRAKKLYDLTPDLRLGTFSARRTEGGFKVMGTFEYPTGRLVTVDGTKKDTATGGPYVFAADVVWDPEGTRWRVLDYAFQEKSER